MVECQLPKLDVVGSSPIARSIICFKKILPDSITIRFLSLFVVSIFLLPHPSFSQIESDPSRPFDGGEIVDLPGTKLFLGDLPHEIKITTEPLFFHSIEGDLATEVGWVDPTRSHQIGLRSSSPGILFEGIPFPLATNKQIGWMSAGGSVEVFDFPSAAWWGPSAASGAVLLQPFSAQSKDSSEISIFGGANGLLGGDYIYRGNLLSVNGNYQHTPPSFINGNGADFINVSSQQNWVKTNTIELNSGFLASQWLTNDYWYLAYSSFSLLSPNFQSLELRPYFQTVQTNGQTAKEVGSYLNYHVNMAGLAESHLGFGISHLDSGPLPTQTDKGFVQSTNFIDVLGDVTFDLALRYDFSSASTALFSDLVGIQNHRGDFVFFANYGKGVLTPASQDVQEANVGIGYQATAEWDAKLKYIHEQVGAHPIDGAKVQVQFNHDRTFLMIFKKPKILIEGQGLQDENGNVVTDFGGQVEFSFFPRNHFWLKGRGGSQQPFFCEAGGDYSFAVAFKAFVSVANLDNLPVAWPDPNLPVGRVLWAGISGQF